ncbi:MAG: helix-turn-helix domain-containing protein [Patescibacteria group bacterium]
MVFSQKRIVNTQSLGERLLEARQEKGLSLERAAKDLNIAFKYLEALENNQFTDLPGKAYLRIFLKRYSQYLNLDFNELWPLARGLAEKENGKFLGADQKYFRSWPRFIRKVLTVLVVLSVLVFLGVKIKLIFSAPSLSILYPADGIIMKEKQIEVRGQSVPEAEIVINNQIVFMDNEGKFSAQVDLQKGLNLIKITAKKRYSRQNEADLRILLQE